SDLTVAAVYDRRRSRSPTSPTVIDRRYSPVLCSLKHVTQRENNAAIAAIGPPLIQEIGGVDAALGNPKVARIGGVIHLRPELDVLALPDPRVLDESEVHVPDAVRPECVAADVTHTHPGRRQRRIECRPARF